MSVGSAAEPVPIEYRGKIIGAMQPMAVADARRGMSVDFAILKPFKLWASLGEPIVERVRLVILEVDANGQPGLFGAYSLRNLRHLPEFRPEDAAIDALKASDGPA